MIPNTAVIELVDSWLTTVIPSLAGRTYDYAPSGKPKGLPDASVILLEERLQLGGGDDVPWGDLQQVRVMAYSLGVSFMVDAGQTDQDERVADQQLRAFADSVFARLAPDGAPLTDRVLIAPNGRMDYATPFAEYEDGTRGREATLTITVAQLL